MDPCDIDDSEMQFGSGLFEKSLSPLLWYRNLIPKIILYSVECRELGLDILKHSYFYNIGPDALESSRGLPKC